MKVVELTDRVTQPVEIKETSNDTSVTTINLAVKPDFVKKDEESNPEFIPVTVWRKLAKVCSDHLCKGYLVGVTDKLQRRSYDTAEGERCHVTPPPLHGSHLWSRNLPPHCTPRTIS
ncbi:MAG: single-stranded DNA-binding protein [Selenomonas ruminantium]|nr:single-stranded DNA-binding protein [Selenomonas ruminantium]